MAYITLRTVNKYHSYVVTCCSLFI